MGQAEHEDVDQSEIRVSQGNPRVGAKQIASGLQSAFRVSGTEASAPTISERVREAAVRVERAAGEVRDARARHLDQYRKEGRALPPTTSPRIAELAQAVSPKSSMSVAARDRSDLGRLDRFIGAMQRDITNDPLWLAADHVERNTALLTVDKLVREAPEIQQVQDAYKIAEQRFLGAKADIEAFEKRPGWAQWVDAKLRDQDLKLRQAYDHAAEHLLTAKHQVERTEREVRAAVEATVTEHNGAELNKQREARERRESLEQPLREALVERHVAEALTIRGETQLARLQDAPEGTSLKVSGTFQVGSFDVVELKSADARTYLADTISLKLHAEAVEVGRTFDVGCTPEGTMVLQAASTTEQTLARGPVEGTVVDHEWQAGKLTRLTLEQADQKRVSLVPARDNLLNDVRAPGILAELRQGDRVHLENGQVRVLGRAKAPAVALGR